MINITTLLPLIGHPRDSKRISMLKDAGFSIQALAFDRDYHDGRLPDCDVKNLGTLKHGEYLRRIVSLLKATFTVRAEVKNSDALYCSGFDMLILGLLASIGRKQALFIEVGDIREIQVSSAWTGHLFRRIEKLLMQRVDLLVVTAPDFLTEYYSKILSAKTKTMVLENKLEPRLQGKRSITQTYEDTGRAIRIGYFGLLRCSWSLSTLRRLAVGHKTEFEIVLAGIPFGGVEGFTELLSLPNVDYLGEYKSPDDLEGLYSRIDLVWACYPPIEDNDWNLKWARPNRFYEACYYGKPMVSRDGSNDAKANVEYQIGIVLSEIDEELAANEIAASTWSDISTWTKNVLSLPRNVFEYTTEYQDLANHVSDICTIQR